MTSGSTSSECRESLILNMLERYFGIPLAADHDLLQEVETRYLAGGEWLIHQGDTGNALYFLVRGRLQAWAAAPDGEPRGRLLNEIVPGDSVGELSLLTGAPRTVGIQAIRDSLLIRIDREAFETLAHEHPALVLRLAANVATLLQSASSKTRRSTRNLKAVSILPLDGTPRIARFCEQLADQLQQAGATLNLTADRLGASGAPVEAVAPGDTVPHALVHWLHDQEDRHRFVLYRCSGDNPAWTDFVAALSPNGGRIAFNCRDGNRVEVCLRELDSLTAEPIVEARDVELIFFSPDGEWLAIWSPDRLAKVPVGGGMPQTIFEKPPEGVARFAHG